MAAQICIKMARGTFFQLVRKTQSFSTGFLQARYTNYKYIYKGALEPYFSTRLISLSKPHSKVIKKIANNSKKNVKHKKLKKHKLKSEIKFN